MVSTVIGEEIKINNGKNMKGSINIEGNTYQEVEDGKNKAIIPDREETFHGIDINIKDGVLNITGTSNVTYTSYRVVGAAKLKAGKTYYLKLFGTKSGSAALAKDSEVQWFPDSENQEYEFTPTVGGTYNIQLGFGGGEKQNWNAKYMVSEESEADWVEGKEATPTLVNPSEVQAVGDDGSVEIVKSNKNILDFGNQTGNGITFSKNKVTIVNPTGYLYSNNNNISGNKFLSGKTVNFSFISNGNVTGDNNIQFIFHTNKKTYVINKQYNKGNYANEIFTKEVVLADDEVMSSIQIYTAGTTGKLTIDVQVEISDEATDFIEHKGDEYVLPIQKPFYKLIGWGSQLNNEIKDTFIKQNNKWYEQHNNRKVFLKDLDWAVGSTAAGKAVNTKRWNSVSKFPHYESGIDHYAKSNSFNNVSGNLFNNDKEGFNIESNSICIRIPVEVAANPTQVKEYFTQRASEGKNDYVVYPLATPELIECTEEQTQVLEQLSNLYLYEGINYLYSTDDLSPIFQFSYDKIVNDFKFYLSENGRLIFPNENISFLCSISESSIPSMPEALETSATIAGRDGDVPLSTTYGPMSFELVLYTEDNLTPEEKLKQEIFLNRFCNLIKNNTETFALELAQKFYKIKYNGVLSKENYPKFLRFTLPFKSSKSFAYDVKKHIIYGNSTVESNTIEPTGFECVIKGPAIKPIISLNDYSIEYNNTILDDESLIIDTNNSTAVLVNSEGTRVNAMRYYNHQFPKILNGENELKILSGIDNPENVSISWYDLTL